MTRPAWRRAPLLAWAPRLTLAAFLLPIVAGLAGTLLPAFTWLPALGRDRVSLDAWRELIAAPGVMTAWRLTIVTGWAATLGSVTIALLVVAFVHHRPWARRLGDAMTPMLAMPHSALAIGFTFVILPSGWIARAISPQLSGWDLPPDVSTVGHASGWPLVAALMLKEVPYLMLMTLGALQQVNAHAHVTAARALGYGPVQAWLAVVLPQVLPQIRLPIYAVLSFSLSVVDVAIVLGPGNPPTLAALAVRWFADPDLRWVFPASAAAVLLLLTMVASIACAWLLERAWVRSTVRRIERGARSRASERVAAAACTVATLLLVLALLSMLAMALWSLAAQWRWPDAWPAAWTLANWQRQANNVAGPAWTTLALGAVTTTLALALALACLEHEAQRATLHERDAAAPQTKTTHGKTARYRSTGPTASRSLWLLYLPLIVPQVAFLFGLQVLLVRIGADGHFWAVAWAHLVFVLPYLFLSLADPWRAFDERWTRSALALGASRWRVFWRIKLPILIAPVALAAAVAFAVSVGLYLPTLLVGTGRVATLTTEAVTLSAGADRRVIGIWSLMQAALPLLVYALAVAWPRVAQPHRRAGAR